MDWAWIETTGTAILMVLLSGVGIYVVLLLFVRLSGLRSFAKFSSFDFAITVAMGSLIAATLLSDDPPLLQGAAGLAALFGIQFAVSYARRHWTWAQRLVDNRPLLIMAGEDVLHDALDQARMTEEDLKSKLRMAGVVHPSEVLAVVVETTGDVAVLKRDADADFDPEIFSDVQGVDRLFRERSGHDDAR